MQEHSRLLRRSGEGLYAFNAGSRQHRPNYNAKAFRMQRKNANRSWFVGAPNETKTNNAVVCHSRAGGNRGFELSSENFVKEKNGLASRVITGPYSRLRGNDIRLSFAEPRLKGTFVLDFLYYCLRRNGSPPSRG
jgi:hypothetical protein